MATPIKIYAAGRISSNDWRNRIGLSKLLKDVLHGDDLDETMTYGFPQLEGIANGVPYIYTGPFFIGCNHGCAHGASMHGLGLGSESGCIRLHHDYSGYEGRRQIAHACFKAIDESDVVFAWLEREAYGTIAELAYAYAKGKKVWVVGRGTDLNGELWFPAMTGYVVIDEEITPETAFSRVVRRVTPMTESPIEQHLLDAFEAVGFYYSGEAGGFVVSDGDVLIAPQFEIGKYRLDFLVTNKKTGEKIDVELDGHDFHERTKEQASRDKARDRYMQTNGFKVFRFTGSDVHQDVGRCVREVLSAVRSEEK
jgi:very-short-patch-repair endonuclease